MFGAYASVAAILVGSLVLGRALLHVLGLTTRIWLSGAIGFAVLLVACPLLIRLPGRATTVALVLGLAIIGAILYLWRHERAHGDRGAEIRTGRAPHSDWPTATLVALIILVATSLPFAFNERNGVLGEGIYTNDQAAQLFWTDWLEHGVGPEPNAVRFGYPTGPQSVAATAAEATNTTLVNSFNGLLLAISILTALAALTALEALPSGRRVIAASLTALPYLAASYLAQSAFKETAMALLVLAFAVGLRELALVNRGATRHGGPHPRRALVVGLALLALASLFVYSIPGLVWFALAVPIWLVLEILTGGLRLDLGAARAAASRHRIPILVVALLVLVVAAFSITQLSGFVNKVGMVQQSAGRLSSPVFPGEALGIWPQGDFRVVRGDVSLAYPALALGILAAAFGAVAAFRRRDWGLIAMGAGAVIVYVGARIFASIYVDAKALAIMAPLVVMAALLALFAPSWSAEGSPPARAQHEEGRDRRTIARYVLGGIVAAALAASTFLALRAAPVGFDQRGKELESLSGLIQNRSVAFLGVDRFGGYWLRGTLVRSPGGYIPAEVQARAKKIWQQGDSMDFDTLSPAHLDEFDYAITTRAGYQSTPPPNFTPAARTTSFVLWKRDGPTPQLGVIDKPGTPGRVLGCPNGASQGLASRPGTATVLHRPVVGGEDAWSRNSPFDAPGTATQTLRLPPGRWDLSLQYHSQAPLVIAGGGESFTVPPSLDGMYLTHQAQGSFWPAGSLRSKGGPVKVTVSAKRPTDFQRLLGVRRQVWLGPLAATRPGSTTVPLSKACGRFVDHFTVR